jgi:hypothetical protein
MSLLATQHVIDGAEVAALSGKTFQTAGPATSQPLAEHPDGHWENSPFLLPGGPTQASNLEVTTEFLQHRCIVSAALGGAGPACDSC